MAYRGDVEALEARVAALTADLAVRVRERDDAARLLDEARARAHAEAFIADLESGGPARRRRKRVRIAAITAGIAMILGGVLAFRARPHHDDRYETAMRAFEQFTDDMCQCQDSACAMHVSDDMTRWATTMAKDWQPEPKLDEAQIKRATELGQRMGECMTKAMSVGVPDMARY